MDARISQGFSVLSKEDCRLTPRESCQITRVRGLGGVAKSEIRITKHEGNSNIEKPNDRNARLAGICQHANQKIPWTEYSFDGISCGQEG